MSQHVTTMIPIQVLADIDNARNPLQLTKERLERAATENQFMNGKIHAVDSYRHYLDEMLIQNFPELSEHLQDPHAAGPSMMVDTGAAPPSASDPVTMPMNGTHPV